ncbi:MAG: valine--pyruvate transaminase [Chromatiales bacterium]|jgi:valine--pyruvate aminotransferase|nr:valine--pyruvate transaminase [Chromatiales bacterium]
MDLSTFGQRFARKTGARELMDDLGAALSGGSAMKMLGGGNPAHIPEVQALFRERMVQVMNDEPLFKRMLANYPAPAGEEYFRVALAGLLNREYGWDLSEKNIALTAGSQSSFFLLFNLFAGPMPGNKVDRKILLPLTPEYIGYADLGVEENMLRSYQPEIEILDDHLFKYRVDFDALAEDESGDLGAVCVSRPTNPTGNVLTDNEMDHLTRFARARDIPLIVDNAYGAPFPGIIFSDITPVWNSETVLCLSLSKIGLPGVRTGIVVANEDVIDALTSMNAVLSLAVGSVGPVLAQSLVETGAIMQLSREVIRPYYETKAMQAVDWCREALEGVDFHIHKPEGALFLWLWFPDLPVSSEALYQRLKQRGVLVIGGQHFFPGLQQDWPHSRECIRVAYSQDDQVVREGIEIIGDELRRIWAEA